MELIKIENNVPVLDAEISSQIAEFERQAKLIEEQEKRLKSAILREMKRKGILKIETDDMTITYVAPYDREKFDAKAFKSDHMDLYDEYVSMNTVSESVKVKVK